MIRSDVGLESLVEFLKKVDNAFPVYISKKTDIDEYACKIHKYGKTLAYMDNGEIVGMALYYDNNHESKIAYLSMIAVLKDFRGQGIASELLDTFMRKSRHAGMLFVELYTHKTNKQAIKLYEKFGFSSSTDESRPDDIKFSISLVQGNAYSILVTAIGSFAADIVIKNLQKAGHFVIGTDIHAKELIVDAYHVDRFFQSPNAHETGAYIEFIRRLCESENIQVIIPLTDVEIDALNVHRQLFEQNGIKVLMSSRKTIEICRNKQVLHDYLLEHGIQEVIPTSRMPDVREDSLSYPVVCKPLNGRSSEGLYIVKSEEEFLRVKSTINCNNYIVQPFIKGDIITVDVVRQPLTNQCIAVPRKELLRTLSGAGTSVHVFSDKQIESLSIGIANLLDIIGCANFEFILDEHGKYHFIECNARFSGGVEFSCMSGYDCVTNHLRCFLGEPIDDSCCIEEQYIARKYEEFVTQKRLSVSE